jgi:alkylation response protein AidB-like acyl-CoA dehydrogenase
LSFHDIASILSTTDEITNAIVFPQADMVDRLGQWPEQSLRAFQAAGLGGLVVPAAYDGLGFGLLAVAQVCERLGAACASTGLCFGMHCVGAAVLSAKATSSQAEQYLVPIAAGKHLTTLSLSEAGTGSHFYFPETQLSEVADGYRVDGEKTFVTSGGRADSYVVSTVAADPTAIPGTFSCVVIEADSPGLAWGPEWNGMGMRGNSSRTLKLQNVNISKNALLGEEGDQIWYVFNVVAPYFLMSMAGTYLGIAMAAFEEGRSHLMKRTYSHTGHAIGNSSVIQHRLGTIWAQIERTRRLIYHAAVQGDSGSSDALPTLLAAKAEVAGCVVNVVNEMMTLAGGKTYQSESRLHRHLRDARAAHIMSPTTDLLYTWLGRTLLDLPLLGD